MDRRRGWGRGCFRAMIYCHGARRSRGTGGATGARQCCLCLLTRWFCGEQRGVLVAIVADRDRNLGPGGVEEVGETFLELGEVGHGGRALFW